MSSPIDPRERAFEALLPVAPVIQRVLGRVDEEILADIERNLAARAGWTAPQRKTQLGYTRFCEAVTGCKSELPAQPGVSYISTPVDEASNRFLWQLGGFLTLRIKSEPSDLHVERTEPMFARNASLADQTVCLSWDVTGKGTIINARFVSVHDIDPWSITLVELLAAGTNLPSIGGDRPGGGPRVSSTRPKQDEERADAPDTPS